MKVDCDYLVIGSGLAGLWFALRAAGRGDVCVVTKKGVGDGNTRRAQGGVAAVVHPDDSLDAHVTDTLEAGAGLCDEEAVRTCVREGPDRVRELIEFGVDFTRSEGGEYDLGLEGGHSCRRVLHAADMTGAVIQEAMVEAVKSHPAIRLLEHHHAIDLITERRVHRLATRDRCLGAYVLDAATGDVRTLLARATVLATGGVGKVYLFTSNPDVATGDGIAMAWRAGATISNMEFIQFHPTCLYHPAAKNFLISEALRGEGGELVDAAGREFMSRIDPRGSLAPRDVVARGIDREIKRTGADCVFLDMTRLGPGRVVERFPNIHAECLRFGIDMRTQPIPVVPAAHYCCGGVRTDLDGTTDVPGLYAVGETACTGLHGANRLASNSLLECLVFAHRAARHASEHAARHAAAEIERVRPWETGFAREPEEAVVVSHDWDEIRRSMWNYVGIVRTTRRLERARRRIENLVNEINEYYWEFEVTADLLELRNIAAVARLIVESALHRRESRGLHYTLDYPGLDEARGGFATELRRGTSW